MSEKTKSAMSGETDTDKLTRVRAGLCVCGHPLWAHINGVGVCVAGPPGMQVICDCGHTSLQLDIAWLCEKADSALKAEAECDARKVEDLYEWRCLSCGFEPDDLFTESEGKQRGWDVQKNICPNCNEINVLKAERDALKAAVERTLAVIRDIASEGCERHADGHGDPDCRCRSCIATDYLDGGPR